MNKADKKILHLTLKKKWFDMIVSGEKKEEYREIKRYWWQRLVESHDLEEGEIMTKCFDIVRFKNGYGKSARIIDVEFIETRIAKSGNTAWGWEKKCFGIKLGKTISL